MGKENPSGPCAPALEVHCGGCGWDFLVPGGHVPECCAHCGRTPLEPAGPGDGAPPEPELVVPFAVDEGMAFEALRAFARGVWPRPTGFTAAALRSRARKIYLPVWLVDVDANAAFRAEAGFRYETKNFHERFEQKTGQWKSTESAETRMRWEMRAGAVQRRYDNLSGPALEDDDGLRVLLDGFDVSKAEKADTVLLEGALVRLPSRTREETWPTIVPDVHGRVIEDCRRAAGADEIRAFDWQPRVTQGSWTLMLLPVYSTYYVGDAGAVYPVLVHGRTAAVSGVRRASMEAARRLALAMASVAALMLLGGAVFRLLGRAGLHGFATAADWSLLLAVAAAGIATVPLIKAWRFNSGEGSLPIRQAGPFDF